MTRRLVPHTEADYQRLVAMLDELIDTVGEAEHHPHAGLMEILGALIESYDELMKDLVSIVYSFSARMYGQRRAKRKTEKIVEELKAQDDATS